MTTLTGAGKSANVKKAKLVTKAGYNIDSALGAKVADGYIVGSENWKNGPLKEMVLGNVSAAEGRPSTGRLGVVFPYNPTLNLQGSVAYGQYDLTHTNYQPHFYSATQNQQITLGFNLTASTLSEANYMIGFMWFLRTITKMHFGRGDTKAGTPPPVLEFSCYGDYQFQNVPVVMRNYSYDQSGQEDYVDTSYDSQVPTFLTGFVDIVTQYTPGKVLNEFTLGGFASGSLLKKGYI